ncbi:hypothetical protein RJT34_04064 [Clitoria ternatea]|uniref:Uncharacterized protein n=1 Tax=Clitoria ternatea TaxID=43366 RepID=A0AAN9KK73_CLITE
MFRLRGRLVPLSNRENLHWSSGVSGRKEAGTDKVTACSVTSRHALTLCYTGNCVDLLLSFQYSFLHYNFPLFLFRFC